MLFLSTLTFEGVEVYWLSGCRAIIWVVDGPKICEVPVGLSVRSDRICNGYKYIQNEYPKVGFVPSKYLNRSRAHSLINIESIMTCLCHGCGFNATIHGVPTDQTPSWDIHIYTWVYVPCLISSIMRRDQTLPANEIDWRHGSIPYRTGTVTRKECRTDGEQFWPKRLVEFCGTSTSRVAVYSSIRHSQITFSLTFQISYRF